MATNEDETHPSSGSAGHAALGAAGEAVAFFAGAPIAGAADAAVGLGDVVADREARIEEAITGGHTHEVPARAGVSRIWLVIGALVVLAALVWALKG